MGYWQKAVSAVQAHRVAMAGVLVVELERLKFLVEPVVMYPPAARVVVLPLLLPLLLVVAVAVLAAVGAAAVREALEVLAAQ
jgi:hypothetical protein